MDGGIFRCTFAWHCNLDQSWGNRKEFSVLTFSYDCTQVLWAEKKIGELRCFSVLSCVSQALSSDWWLAGKLLCTVFQGLCLVDSVDSEEVGKEKGQQWPAEVEFRFGRTERSDPVLSCSPSRGRIGVSHPFHQLSLKPGGGGSRLPDWQLAPLLYRRECIFPCWRIRIGIQLPEAVSTQPVCVSVCVRVSCFLSVVTLCLPLW